MSSLQTHYHTNFGFRRSDQIRTHTDYIETHSDRIPTVYRPYIKKNVSRKATAHEHITAMYRLYTQMSWTHGNGLGTYAGHLQIHARRTQTVYELVEHL